MDDRWQIAQALALGAMGKQSRGGQAQSQGIQPTQVVGRQLGFDNSRFVGTQTAPPYSIGQVGATKPAWANTGYQASYSARVRTSRIAAAPPRSAAARHADGTCSVIQARVRCESFARWHPSPYRQLPTRHPHRPVKRGGRRSEKAAKPSLKSSLRDDSSMANPSLRSCSSREASAPAYSSHLVRPSETVGPLAS